MTRRSTARALGAVVASGIVALGATQRQPADSSAGPLANSCGAPTTPAPASRGTPQTFAAGRYPLSLPAVSHLGAPNDLPTPFHPGVHFGRLPPGRTWGSTASVATAPDGTLWVADRCGVFGATGEPCAGANATVAPIFQFDAEGTLLKSFGAGVFASPHKLTVDEAGNLWVADNATHQIFKMSTVDGRILMTLGKRRTAGAGVGEFDAPTEVAVAANGDIFVGDGHTGGGTAVGNARIVKFDKNGKFLSTWGRKGMGPGEFDVVHTLAFDGRGRLFVGDRQNNRIQIFEADGTFVDEWFQFGRPSGIHIDKTTDTLYVADSESRDGRTNTGRFALAQTGYGYNLGARRGIRIGSARDGSVTAFIPDPCPYPYPAVSSMAEGVTVDAQGNVYGADYLMAVRKFVRH